MLHHIVSKQRAASRGQDRSTLRHFFSRGVWCASRNQLNYVIFTNLFETQTKLQKPILPHSCLVHFDFLRMLFFRRWMTTMIKLLKFLQSNPTRVHKPYSVSDQNVVEICKENLLPPIHVICQKLLQTILAVSTKEFVRRRQDTEMLACFLQWQYWKCIFPLHCANVREEVVENIHTPTDGLNVAPAYTQ